MKTLILALAATLIAAPAVAANYDGPTKREADSCSTFLRVTQTPPLPDEEISEAEWAEAGHFCFFATLGWLQDTGRLKPNEGGGTTDTEIALGRCGAQIILRYNDDTPIADALAAEFDTACGEPPAIM